MTIWPIQSDYLTSTGCVLQKAATAWRYEEHHQFAMCVWVVHPYHNFPHVLKGLQCDGYGARTHGPNQVRSAGASRAAD